ncbi:hypothetical protein [Rhizobium leguminosarum]|uniref:hypothetical protein n=1 Tax=Rhizobium leguminosarum TaxID=384 RepID=UPI00198199B2|nr:hypothetical protein [Rhizobium leguminosarum]
MPRAFLKPQMRLGFTAILALLAIGLRPAAGTPKCPPQNELLAKAEIVVEARVKSLSIGESGLLLAEGVPTRMIRMDLEIERVIKGKYPGKDAIVYGAVFPPGPFTELTRMALFAGLGGDDTFEWELYRLEISSGVEFFSMNACSYYKFPDYAAGPR